MLPNEAAPDNTLTPEEIALQEEGWKLSVCKFSFPDLDVGIQEKRLKADDPSKRFRVFQNPYRDRVWSIVDPL
jgi:hypothetical protein